MAREWHGTHSSPVARAQPKQCSQKPEFALCCCFINLFSSLPPLHSTPPQLPAPPLSIRPIYLHRCRSEHTPAAALPRFALPSLTGNPADGSRSPERHRGEAHRTGPYRVVSHRIPSHWSVQTRALRRSRLAISLPLGPTRLDGRQGPQTGREPRRSRDATARTRTQAYAHAEIAATSRRGLPTATVIAVARPHTARGDGSRA